MFGLNHDTDTTVVNSTTTTGPEDHLNNPNNPNHHHHHNHIFHERVSRALAVRTDTTAMKTALDALSQLQLQQQQQQLQYSNNNNNNNSSSSGTATDSSSDKLQELGRIITSMSLSGGGTTSNSTSISNTHTNTNMMMIDSRSVRTMMEYDALQQAMLVQTSVLEILHQMTQLQNHCQTIVTTSQLIRAMIHNNNNDDDDSSAVDVDTSKDSKTTTATPTLDSNISSNNSNEEEYQVATQIHHVIQQRDMIQTQLQTLQLFVQQYHLSDEDIHLLEQYHSFDENINNTTTNNHNNNSNGMAFLQALQRIRNIRNALQEKFGTSLNSTSNSNTLLLGCTTDTTTTTATTTTALKLMEQLSIQQENAYERLYHWLQQYLQRSSTSSNSGEHDNVMSNSANDHHHPNDFVLYSIQALKYMTAPYYYNHCIELMAAQRRTVVTRTFLLALTVGMTSDDTNDHHHVSQPPIEMKSYDSVAYVGDMLAFAFKSYTLEADLTKNLLLYQSPISEHDESIKDGLMDSNTDGSERRFDESLNNDKNTLGMSLFSEINDHYDAPEEKALSTIDMLSISMSGIVRPLKSRILQVITSLCRRNDTSEVDEDDDIYDKYNLNDEQEDDGSHIRTRVGQLYDICGLLLFYYTTILRSVSSLSNQSSSFMMHSTGSTMVSDGTITGALTKSKELNPLLDCILECFVEATQGYEATVRVYCAMIDQIAMLSGKSIATLMQRLLVLLIQIRTNSPGYLEDVTQECPNTMCQETLSMEWVTETLISTCFNIATISIDDIITIKELFQITKRNSNICFDVSRAIQLETLITQKEKAMIDELIKTETFNVFDLCGLTTIVNGWDRYKNNEATATDANNRPLTNMSTYPGLTSHDIETGIKEFYTSLYSPPIPSFEMTIQDPNTRKVVRSNIANAIVSFYEELHIAVQSDANSYDETTRRLFQHTPQELQTLFSI